jgi:hypothetical protein
MTMRIVSVLPVAAAAGDTQTRQTLRKNMLSPNIYVTGEGSQRAERGVAIRIRWHEAPPGEKTAQVDFPPPFSSMICCSSPTKEAVSPSIGPVFFSQSRWTGGVTWLF